MSRYPLFDRSRIELFNLAERGHDLLAENCLPLSNPPKRFAHADWPALIERIEKARSDDRPVILMSGAHPIKLGLSRFVVDMIRRGVITHWATNGAGMIHDFELASFGGTSEDVAKWIRNGRFGMWRETSQLNEIVREAAANGTGLGETVGRALSESSAEHADLSLAVVAWESGVPMTVHVGVGSDIIHEHANCDGSAVGAASYTDFLIFANAIEQLEGGVFLNVGTAVTGPEVYLKALSMARNVASREGRDICHFTTAVFDLVELPENWREGPPSKEHRQYYYRPWKTILERTVADGGTSFYFRGNHRETVPTLWADTRDIR